MDLLAPITRWIVAPAWAWWESSPYLRHRRRLLRTQFDPPDVVRRRQWERLRPLLRHAADTCPFWRRRFEEAGLSAERVRSFEDFSRLPLLTKTDLRAGRPLAGHGEMISDAYRKANLLRKATSGSTGVAVEVFVDEDAQQFKRACTVRSDEWSGWRLGERVAVLWGAEEQPRRGWRPWLRGALLERTTRLDTLRINEESMARFLAALRRRPPRLLFGHAHSLYLLARFVEEGAGASTRRRREFGRTASFPPPWSSTTGNGG